MDGPTTGGEGMPVAAGARPTGSLYGKKAGKGQAKTGGGGGPPDSTGTGVASVAAVKEMPRPIGNYERENVGKDYPAEALRNAVEGAVSVRILVNDKGTVAEATVVKGLGFGLDEKALELARRLKFEPARDTGKDDTPAGEAVEQQGRGQRAVHLANTGFRQDHRMAVQRPPAELQAGGGLPPGLDEMRAEGGDLFGNGGKNGERARVGHLKSIG